MTTYMKIYFQCQKILKIWLEKGVAEKQLEVLGKQLDLLKAQAEAEDAKKQLYKRQIEGFDEDFKHKILKTLLDSWAVGFSVSKDSPTLASIPTIIGGNFITGLYNDRIATELANSSVRVSTQPMYLLFTYS